MDQVRMDSTFGELIFSQKSFTQSRRSSIAVTEQSSLSDKGREGGYPSGSQTVPRKLGLDRVLQGSPLAQEKSNLEDEAKNRPLTSSLARGSGAQLLKESLLKRGSSFVIGTTKSILQQEEIPDKKTEQSEEFTRGNFTILVVGQDCNHEKALLKKADYKVFGVGDGEGAAALLQKYKKSINMVLLSSSVEDVRNGSTIEQLVQNTKAIIDIPIIGRRAIGLLKNAVIYDENFFSDIDTIQDKGANDWIPHQLHLSLFLRRIEAQIQLYWYKQLFVGERAKRVKIEADFNKISQYTGPREADEEDIESVASVWGANGNVVANFFEQQAKKSKSEVHMEDYRKGVVKIVKENNPESTGPMKDSKFSTLDKRSKEWVLKEFSRIREDVAAPSPPATRREYQVLFEPCSEVTNNQEIMNKLGEKPESDEKSDTNTMRKARKAFVKYDQNSDGALSLNEVAAALKDLGMDQDNAIKLMNKLDSDNNGSISFKEFLKGLPNEQEKTPQILSSTPVKLQSIFSPPSSPTVIVTAENGETIFSDNNGKFRCVDPPPELSSRTAYDACIMKYKDNFKSWEFDQWKCSEDELSHLCLFMFEDNGFLELFSIPRELFLKFLFNVRRGYKSNEYHNWRHAVDVAHACFLFTTKFGAGYYLTHSELFALLIAALCHDVDHPGVNNNFQVNIQSQLAMRYNDTSVLENHHCACTFEITQDSSCNIFANFLPKEFKDMRKTIIDAILQTDMAYHFDLVAKFSARIQKPEKLSKDSKPDKQLLVNVLLHTADLSNAMKPWGLSKSWSMHVQEEFLQQGDKEKEIGLPVSMYMDRLNYDQPRMSLNFIDFIVEPLIAGLKQLLPDMALPLNCLYYNRKMWTEIDTENKRRNGEQIPEEAGKSTIPEKPASPDLIEEDLDEEPNSNPKLEKTETISTVTPESRKWSVRSEVSRIEAKTAWADDSLAIRPSSESLSNSSAKRTSPKPTPVFPLASKNPTFTQKKKRPSTAGGFYFAKRNIKHGSHFKGTKVTRQILITLDKIPPSSTL